MNLETVKITKVFISDKSKDGKEFKTKDGKKFWKVAIKTDKYADVWLSDLAFGQNDEVMSLKEGDEVEIVISESNGYKNFKLPSRLDKIEARLEALEKWKIAMSEPSPPENEIGADDIPF